MFVSDIAIFVLKRDVKLQLTNWTVICGGDAACYRITLTTCSSYSLLFEQYTIFDTMFKVQSYLDVRMIVILQHGHCLNTARSYDHTHATHMQSVCHNHWASLIQVSSVLLTYKMLFWWLKSFNSTVVQDWIPALGTQNTTSHSSPALLATSALSLMNTSSLHTRSQLSPNAAIIIFVNLPLARLLNSL